MYTPFEFEGRMVPAQDALAEQLVDDVDRAWLVRASVVEYAFADAALACCEGLLHDDRPAARGAAINVGRALLGRPLVGAVCVALAERTEDFVGIIDPVHPERTLAQSAVDFLMFAPTPGDSRAREALRLAMSVPELRVQAWDGLGGDEPLTVLPHLAALLTEAPEMAESVATRFALVHTEHVLAAAEAVAGVSEETRKVFGDYLEKHLKRIFHVRRWVECRRALFGR